jgi:hypothetical protein
MTKYRPHRGGLAESMKEAVDVSDFSSLVERMRLEVKEWYPKDDLPTLENTKVEPYCFDHRIGWDTHIVTVKGNAWGFTDGPLHRS